MGEEEQIADLDSRPKWLSLMVALGLAILSGLLVRLILNRLFEGGVGIDEETEMANLFLVTLPFLVGYLAWLRRVPIRVAVGLGAAVAVLALAVNLYPLIPGYQHSRNTMTYEYQSQTGVLTMLHLPIVLWLLASLAFAHHLRRNTSSGRLDFIRFTGDWVVFLILTWLVGGAIIGIVFAALTMSGVEIWRSGMGFSAIVANLVPIWLFLSAWLADQTRTIISKVLAIMTAVFTPIMVLALLIIFGVFVTSGTLFSINRELLILLDAVLVIVLALVLYSVAARNPEQRPGALDWLQLAMIALAVVMNLLALIWMFMRLAEFGWTANRAAALGLNLILMVNLTWTAWLLIKFIRQGRFQSLVPAGNWATSDISKRPLLNRIHKMPDASNNFADADYEYETPEELQAERTASAIVPAKTEYVTPVQEIQQENNARAFHKIIAWQTNYLPVYAIWAAIVVLVFPLIFSIRW